MYLVVKIQKERYIRGIKKFENNKQVTTDVFRD